MVALLAVLGAFAVIAAGMAFLISYDELSQHVRARRMVLREALRTGVVTLAFFGGLIVVIVLVLRP